MRFDGWICGLGTGRGLRVVVGHWPRSPFGPFTDVMVERPDGHRLLLAPTRQVAEFVSRTYRFDEIQIGPVTTSIGAAERWSVEAGPLALSFDVTGRTTLGWLLSAVPRRLATATWWVATIDAVARRVLPGVRTRGTAGGGRQEFYAALDVNRIARATVAWQGVDQGGLAPVDPPVRFGFGSTPRTPSVVRIVTLVREARAGAPLCSSPRQSRRSG